MIALRCWVSALLLLAVAGCSATAPSNHPAPITRVVSSERCDVFVEAWVGHFQANVAKLDGQQTASLNQELLQAREALSAAGEDETSCQLPFCIIQPKAGGRLDSYCGYRVSDPTGNELYRWIPWTPARR